MLDIDIQFVRGALLVRLDGRLNMSSTKELENSLKEIIMNGGIKYLVFNINNSILEERIELFDICNELIKNNNGKMFICGLRSKIESVISSNYEFCDKINNELMALKKISLC